MTHQELFNILQTRAKASDITFEYDDTNNNTISALCEYFVGDANFEVQWGELKKNIMLFGPIGCGKTTIMKLLQNNPKQDYTVINVHRVASAYAQKGIEGIKEYWSGAKKYCFDDLGIELEHGEKQHMGNKLNVMQYVITMCYDFKIPFHLTTNLSVPEIEQLYGNRMRSRLRELCTLVTFSPDAKDRRK